MKRLSARRRNSCRSLTGLLIYKTMKSLFPKKNDYGDRSFDELIPEVARFGVANVGQFRLLMMKHRRKLLRIDREKLRPNEIEFYRAELGHQFVTDAVRRQYWFSYQALIRNAIELEFGESAATYDEIM